MKKIVYFRDGFPQSIKEQPALRVPRPDHGRRADDLRSGVRRVAEADEGLEPAAGHGADRDGLHQPAQPQLCAQPPAASEAPRGLPLDRGEFQFNPKAQPPADTVRLQMSTAAIVYEGVKRSYDAARLLDSLGEIAGKYVHPAEDPLFAAQDMSLGEEEAGLLALMDGSRTVRELRAQRAAVAPGHRPVPVRAAGLADGGAPERAPDRTAATSTAPDVGGAGPRGPALGRRRGGPRARG